MMRTMSEKEAMVRKLKEEVMALVGAVEGMVGQAQLHEAEGEVFQQLLQIGRSCMDYYLTECGTGDDREHPPRATDGTPLTFKGSVTSP